MSFEITSEGLIVRGMEDDLRRSQEFLVKVEESEACLVCPRDVKGIANVLAKKARN